MNAEQAWYLVSQSNAQMCNSCVIEISSKIREPFGLQTFENGLNNGLKVCYVDALNIIWNNRPFKNQTDSGPSKN